MAGMVDISNRVRAAALAAKTPAGSEALRLQNVTLNRGGRNLLSGISFSIPQGSTLAIIGPNGSGKSTLLRMLQAFEWPTSGAVHVLGHRLGQTHIDALRCHVRLVGSAGRLDFAAELSLWQVVSTGLAGNMLASDKPPGPVARCISKALGSVGLSRRGHVLWAHASAGERTRTLLARARLTQAGVPSLILLDEPTANLDPAARQKVVAALAKPLAKMTQVIVTHHLEELPGTTSHALLLREGRALAFGPARQTLTSENLSRTFGVPVAVSFRSGSWRAILPPCR